MTFSLATQVNIRVVSQILMFSVIVYLVDPNREVRNLCGFFLPI